MSNTEPPKPLLSPAPTSFWWHLVTFVVLVAGLVAGALLAWHFQFVAKVGAELPAEDARTHLVALGLGLLGAATQLSIGWAKAVNAQLTGESKYLPCPIEPLGYLMKLCWGAVTGVMTNLAAQTGAMVTVTNTANTAPLKPEASALLAFCAGLTAFRMLQWLSDLFRPSKNGNNSQLSSGSAKAATP